MSRRAELPSARQDQAEGHETCPCACHSKGHRDMQFPPGSLQGFSRGPPGGLRLCPAPRADTWWRRDRRGTRGGYLPEE